MENQQPIKQKDLQYFIEIQEARIREQGIVARGIYSANSYVALERAAWAYAEYKEQQAKETAWEEGFDAGYNHQYALKGKAKSINPYKTKEDA